MFPRIKTTAGKKRNYEYLVISQSLRDGRGRSTTKDVATLGNVESFTKETISNLVDGLIRLFKLDEYARADEVEILASLEHGSIVFWRALWKRLGLGKTVAKQVAQSESRITIDVARYVELMVVNRCANPLSKLATSRWMDTTCYAAMTDYADLPRDVEYFYRSMDYLLKAKDRIEKALFERMRNLFSINVRMTFYDITSTFFHSDACPLAYHGHSRDNRPDKKQVVIGVLTSYEGYPLKHYVFQGNTKDAATVGEVVRQLKKEYHIEETTFVGDRGMITKLNLERIEAEQFDYIMGVKHRQDEMMPMLLEDDRLFEGKVTEWRGLKIADRHVDVKAFVLWKTARILDLSEGERQTDAWCRFADSVARIEGVETIDSAWARELCNGLGREDRSLPGKVTRLLRKHQQRCAETIRIVCALNESRAQQSRERRTGKIVELSGELDKALAGKEHGRELRMENVFEGHKRRYRRLFRWERKNPEAPPVGYRLNDDAIAAESRCDGVFMLATTREDLSARKVVESYKNLQEVETLFDDLKHFVDIHPVRHWLETRVRAHVFLCILALLLKRVLEIDCLKSKALTETLETVATSKLVRYRVRMSPRSPETRTFWKVTTLTPEQDRCFAAAGVKNPQSLEPYVW